MIIEGTSISDSDIEYWSNYMYSKSKDTGAGSGGWNPEAAGSTILEAEAPPDTGPVIGVYDPEIQALLAFE